MDENATGPIRPNEIGTDESRARRVLIRARDIAPTLDRLDGEPRKDAIAILVGVYEEMPDAGERRLRRLSRNGTGMDLDEAGPMFTVDDERMLRSLCEKVTTDAAPVSMGSFPVADLGARLWPEERY